MTENLQIQTIWVLANLSGSVFAFKPWTVLLTNLLVVLPALKSILSLLHHNETS